MTSHVILPEQGRAAICRCEDGRVTPLLQLSGLGAAPRFVTDAGQTMLAAFDDARRSVSVWHIDRDRVRTLIDAEPVPVDVAVHCLTIVEDILYLGGARADARVGNYRGGQNFRSLLWWRPLRGSDPWQPVHIPSEYGSWNKAIDGFVLEGTRLVAVDNIALPKAFLIFDVREPQRPALLDTVHMPAHTSYEHVFLCAAGPSWVALGSKGINHGRRSYYLSVLNRETLNERFLYHAALREAELFTFKDALGRLLGRPKIPTPVGAQPTLGHDLPQEFHDLAFCGDRLLLAAGRYGLGVIDLPTRRPGSADEVLRRGWDPPATRPPPLRIVELAQPKAELRRVITTPDDGAIYLVLELQGRSWWQRAELG